MKHTPVPLAVFLGTALLITTTALAPPPFSSLPSPPPSPRPPPTTFTAADFSHGIVLGPVRPDECHTFPTNTTHVMVSELGETSWVNARLEQVYEHPSKKMFANASWARLIKNGDDVPYPVNVSKHDTLQLKLCAKSEFASSRTVILWCGSSSYSATITTFHRTVDSDAQPFT